MALQERTETDGFLLVCLSKNNYDEAKCSRLVDALYECCQAFYDRQGLGASTISCPKPSVLKTKRKQNTDAGKASS